MNICIPFFLRRAKILKIILAITVKETGIPILQEWNTPLHSCAAVIQHEPLPYCTLIMLLYESCSVVLPTFPHNWEFHGCGPIPTMQNACRQCSCHCCIAWRALAMRNRPPPIWMEIKTELRLKQEWKMYPNADMTSSPFLPYHHWFLVFLSKATAGDWSRLLCGFPSWQ